MSASYCNIVSIFSVSCVYYAILFFVCTYDTMYSSTVVLVSTYTSCVIVTQCSGIIIVHPVTYPTIKDRERAACHPFGFTSFKVFPSQTKKVMVIYCIVRNFIIGFWLAIQINKKQTFTFSLLLASCLSCSTIYIILFQPERCAGKRSDIYPCICRLWRVSSGSSPSYKCVSNSFDQ